MALFGIKRIQYCKATQLAFSGQNNPFLGIASEPTNTFTDVVCMINSRATLTIEQAVVNKQIVYTAKLQFVTPADPMLDVDHYAFIATTNEGERILLGANTRPQVAVVTAQGVFGNAGELTAYTTTAEFKADYRPLRLPVTAAEPISGPAYDICCGQIPVGTPVSGPAYDVCCGEIVGSPTMLTVIWQNYDGTEVDRATYPEGSPEPTTSVVPTRPATAEYTYTFNGWSLYSQTDTTKIYRAQYTAVPVQMRTVAEVSGVEAVRYEYSYDGKRGYTYASLATMQFSDYELARMVVLKVQPDSDITGITWDEQYLPTPKTWVVDNAIRLGYYTGNNQPTTLQRLIWMQGYGGNSNIYEDWNFYEGKAIYPPTPPTREGYTFKGWAATQGGAVVTDYGNMPNDLKQMWAIWEAI